MSPRVPAMRSTALGLGSRRRRLAAAPLAAAFTAPLGQRDLTHAPRAEPASTPIAVAPRLGLPAERVRRGSAKRPDWRRRPLAAPRPRSPAAPAATRPSVLAAAPACLRPRRPPRRRPSAQRRRSRARRKFMMLQRIQRLSDSKPFKTHRPSNRARKWCDAQARARGPPGHHRLIVSWAARDRGSAASEEALPAQNTLGARARLPRGRPTAPRPRVQNGVGVVL